MVVMITRHGVGPVVSVGFLFRRPQFRQCSPSPTAPSFRPQAGRLGGWNARHSSSAAVSPVGTFVSPSFTAVAAPVVTGAHVASPSGLVISACRGPCRHGLGIPISAVSLRSQRPPLAVVSALAAAAIGVGRVIDNRSLTTSSEPTESRCGVGSIEGDINTCSGRRRAFLVWFGSDQRDHGAARPAARCVLNVYAGLV